MRLKMVKTTLTMITEFSDGSFHCESLTVTHDKDWAQRAYRGRTDDEIRKIYEDLAE